ncbi:MAG: VPLPA-CTERM sorting domain-containing protein [Rhodobacteraceae bacterium]|nr:VPLPA-CTERM sorting domain-containing protein [Paracoccaceae bacterium]
MLKNLAAVSAALLIFTGAASAATMFSDDFSSYGSKTELNAPDSLFGGAWSTTEGTVDYLAEGDIFGGLCQGTGNCIDLDGTTTNSGIFSSIEFDAGSYTLDIGLFGSGRDTTETVTITLGDWTTTISNIGAADDASTSFSFSTTGGALSFENAGGDNIGAILTSVDLAPVPLPSGGLLLLAGLGGLAMVRRKKA